jgi:hypothetical protein
MKNIFELFGFLSMACISAAIIFVVMGKKDALRSSLAEAADAEESVELLETTRSPKTITKGIRDSYASDSGSARRAKGSSANEEVSTASAEDRLKSLYGDNEFIQQSIKKWKSAVADLADEYNTKPQTLLANAVVQSYISNYSKSQLQQDAAQHAGDRVMSEAKAAKRFKYAWSVQKVMSDYQLSRYFAEEIPTASASSARMVSSKNTNAKAAVKASAPKVANTAQNNPVEEGFKNMVAKEYGFGSWTGLSRLADPETKANAQRRVKSLMMAARIK